MHRLIIAAPFGNYLAWPYCTSTLGTFTREYRGGFWTRLWRVMRTVRYYPGIQAWKNRLGLPNPGLDAIWPLCLPGALRDRIVSVAARCTEDWDYLLGKVRLLYPLAVELNVSCPNTGESDSSDYARVYRQAADLEVAGIRAIVKLPPLHYLSHLLEARRQGVLAFHCCNTLPTPGGGLSGKPLKQLSLIAVGDAARSGATLVIGGGGVTCLQDAQDYLAAGATQVAVASALFNPLNWRPLKRVAECLAAPGNFQMWARRR